MKSWIFKPADLCLTSSHVAICEASRSQPTLGAFITHTRAISARPHYRAAYHHVLGASFEDDKEIFFAGEDETLRLHIIPGKEHLGFLLFRFLDKLYTDFYLWRCDGDEAPVPVIQDADYKFSPVLVKDDRLLALTDLDAPNSRIVEVLQPNGLKPAFSDLVPTSDSSIQNWMVNGERIFVSRIKRLRIQVDIFDLAGRWLGQLPIGQWDSVRLIGGPENGDELFFEQESFLRPIQICRYSPESHEIKLWAERRLPLDSRGFRHTRVSFTGKDGTAIPMFLVGRAETLENSQHPTVMTSYGGYGISMTPQFSVFVAFLLERGCLCAIPNIRGGSEFGVRWHNAAKRTNRQVAFDDFLCAAEWLVKTGRAEPQRLAIFGGSNSGLLVGAAMTQRPDLFRAVVCLVPMLDMLRYQFFDNAHVWKEEFGTADNPNDFAALVSYSPYHNVRNGIAYPATMLISGDADQNCNPLHARKMTARLQAANASEHPIFLDYSRYRGHSPVLPLSERIEALTDRMAFLCDQLGLPA